MKVNPLEKMETTSKNLHFIAGLDPDFGGKPFGFIHYMAIRSALEVNPGFTAYLYYQFEPKGPYWDLIKNDVITVPVQAPTEIFDRPITHFAHKADVLRLQFLIRTGGIYLDLDTICQKPFEPLLGTKTVLGIESMYPGIDQWYSETSSPICNALIISPAQSPFLRLWYDSYRDFDQNVWNYHSVVLPGILAKRHEELVNVQPPESFFWPHWNSEQLEKFFNEDGEFPHAYSIHLWESLSWNYLEKINSRHVVQIDTAYNKIARKFLNKDFEKLNEIADSNSTQNISKSKTVFSDIYRDGRWGVGSGSGSAADRTADYRSFLEKFIKINQIRSVIDFGCGDWQFSRHIDWQDISYFGYDIVDSVIEKNNTDYASDRIKFEVFRSFDQLPIVDLVICKDVFQHISNEMVLAYVKNLATKGRILLFTNDSNPEHNLNENIDIGEWRSVKLDVAPFFLTGSYVFSFDVDDGLNSLQKLTFLMFGENSTAPGS